MDYRLLVHGNGQDAVCYEMTGTGRGGTVVVDTPVAVSQSGTLVNGQQRSELSSKMLDEMITNYTGWVDDGGAPAVGYFGHTTNSEQAELRRLGIEEPILHVTKLWRSGKELWATLEFMPWAWEKIWADGSMPIRGLSIVMTENGKDRNGKPIGAVFGGVDVVPDPFLPVQIAAARQQAWSRHLNGVSYAGGDDIDWKYFGPAADVEDGDVSNVVKELTDQVTELTKAAADKDAAHAKELEALKTKHAEENKGLSDKVAKLEETVLSLKKESADTAMASESRKAQEAIEMGLENGIITVAEVDGYDKEDDPLAAKKALDKLSWFKDADSMIAFCKSQAGSEAGGRVKMGKKITAGTPNRGAAKNEDGGGDQSQYSKESLAKQYPNSDDEQLESMAAQRPFLDKVDEIHEKGNEGDGKLSYADATLAAERKFPGEFTAYSKALGRDHG
ncbi:MAG: hypothetical protein GY716_10265 [bacterium]|nr:hypothetical protein [bacterium]